MVWARGSGFRAAQSVSESDLCPAIIGAHSHGATRLFRQQSALAWAGKVVNRTATTITLLHPHAMKIGVPGISDIGGLTSHEVTSADIGRLLAVYVAIEAKFGRARPTEEQAAFIAMVRALGGRAGVARSVEEARRIISGDVTL
jgi:hypothetical protein